MAAMAANRRLVLRQWLLEVIKKVEDDLATAKHVPAKVMQMACSPFKPWGHESDMSDDELSEEESGATVLRSAKQEVILEEGITRHVRTPLTFGTVVVSAKSSRTRLASSDLTPLPLNAVADLLGS
ncbi:hypothetical protein EDD15DRAFT_2379776 [Pisolithus albus]|nr:hypothetical protein EDD15DRAFT_2379776 [Pisolithus albus]